MADPTKTDTGDVQVSAPNDNGSTVPLTASNNTPPPQGDQSQAQGQPQVQANAPQLQGVQSSPAQTVSNPQKATMADLGPGGKQADLSKAQAVAANAPATIAQDPAIQKATKFHDVAEVLAGGPRYAYDVDAYGNMQRTKVPVSNTHLALAIAMEALSGAATGMAQTGPGGAGKAAAIAFNQGKQQVSEQDQLAKKEATDDYARRAQVLDTNMKMYAAARSLSKADAETIDTQISNWKDIADKLQKEYAGYVTGPVKYSDFAKYNVTAQNAVPFKREAKFGADGKQVEVNGVPQWDIDYLIVDPNKVKGVGWFNDAYHKAYEQMGQPLGDKDVVDNTPMGLILGMNKRTTADQWMIARDHTVPNFFDSVDEYHKTKQGVTGKATKTAELPEEANTLAEKTASDVGLDTDLLKGLIATESSGNAGAVSSTGVHGYTQLTKLIAKKYGVNRDIPEENMRGGAMYFKDLLDQYKDPRLAYAAYYSGPGAVKNGKIVGTAEHSQEDTTKNADRYAANVGLQQNIPDGTNGTGAPTHNDLVEWTKDHSSTPKDVADLNMALSDTEGNYGKAIAQMRAKGNEDGANNMTAFLGGPDAIADHDKYLTIKDEQRKQDMQIATAETKSADKAASDEAVQSKKVDMIDSLLHVQMPPDILKQSDVDAVDYLKKQGVTLPTDALMEAKAIASYDASITTASNKRWFKDSKMDQGEMLSIVKMFNPAYKTENFDTIKARNMPNSPENKTVESAAQLANHLNTMLDVIDKQDNSKTPFPMMNALLQNIGYHLGKTQKTDVQSMANIVTSELGKTLAGGFAPDKEQINNIISTMNPANATEQMRSIIGLYIAAMHGKVEPLDDVYNQLSGGSDKHMTIPSSLTTLLQREGYSTPWSPKKEQAQSQDNTPPENGAVAGRDKSGNIVAWKLPNGTIKYVNKPQQTQGSSSQNATVDNTMSYIRGGQ